MLIFLVFCENCAINFGFYTKYVGIELLFNGYQLFEPHFMLVFCLVGTQLYEFFDFADRLHRVIVSFLLCFLLDVQRHKLRFYCLPDDMIYILHAKIHSF